MKCGWKSGGIEKEIVKFRTTRLSNRWIYWPVPQLWRRIWPPGRRHLSLKDVNGILFLFINIISLYIDSITRKSSSQRPSFHSSSFLKIGITIDCCRIKRNRTLCGAPFFLRRSIRWWGVCVGVTSLNDHASLPWGVATRADDDSRRDKKKNE